MKDEAFFKLYNAVTKATEELEKVQEEIMNEFMATSPPTEEVVEVIENLKFKKSNVFK